MFNVTVLKMRDIFKVIIGITFLVVVVLGISKIFHKDTKENSKGVQKIENGIKALSQFSMINCMDQTIPTMSSINEEYKNIAKEDDQKEHEENDPHVLRDEVFRKDTSTKHIKERELSLSPLVSVIGLFIFHLSSAFHLYLFCDPQFGAPRTWIMNHLLVRRDRHFPDHSNRGLQIPIKVLFQMSLDVTALHEILHQSVL